MKPTLLKNQPWPLCLGLASIYTFWALPVHAFGDPAQAGANAWCGARSRGASVDEANKQLRQSMASQYSMSTSFAAGLVGLLSNRKGLQSQIEFHISNNCPQYLPSSSSVGRPQTTAEQWDAEMCSKYPYLARKYCDKKPDGSSNKIQDNNGSQIDNNNTGKTTLPTTRNELQKPPKNGRLTPSQQAKVHQLCLKASDYEGCTKHQISILQN